MTRFSEGVEKVLQHVRETAGWALDGDGGFRRYGTADRALCPLVSLTGSHGDYSSEAHRRFGLTSREITGLIRASDGYDHGPLRSALLEAAGLPKEEK